MSEKPEPSQFTQAIKLIDAFKSSLGSYEKFIGAFTKTVHDSVLVPIPANPRFSIDQIVWSVSHSEYVVIVQRAMLGPTYRYLIKRMSGQTEYAVENELSESKPNEIQVGDKVLMDTPKRGCWFRNEEAVIVRTHVPGLLGVKILRTSQTYWVRDYAVNLTVATSTPPPKPSQSATSRKQATTAAQASQAFTFTQRYSFVSDNLPFWKGGDECTYVGAGSGTKIEVAYQGAIFTVEPNRIKILSPDTTEAPNDSTQPSRTDYLPFVWMPSKDFDPGACYGSSSESTY